MTDPHDQGGTDLGLRLHWYVIVDTGRASCGAGPFAIQASDADAVTCLRCQKLLGWKFSAEDAAMLRERRALYAQGQPARILPFQGTA